MTDLHDISIEIVKGIGPARRQLLEKLGIASIHDALRYYPRDYSDRRKVTKVADVLPGTSAVVIGTIRSVRLKKRSWRKSILTLELWEEEGCLTALWFNQPYLRSRFRRGLKVALFGKVGVTPEGGYQMINPIAEILPEGEFSSPHMLRIAPIYPATEELSQTLLRTTLYRAVEGFSDEVREFLPSRTRAALGLLPLSEALRNIHFPVNWKLLEQARKRVIFEEFFLLQVGVALRKKVVTTTPKERFELPPGKDRADSFLSRLPFSLTRAQRRAIDDIGKDLSRPRPMNRLVHGDVGCGKTVVALWAILRTISNGFQASLLAPTELLARQHYGKISSLLGEEDYRVSLLVGPAASKKEIYAGIAEGHTDLVIGTQALIQEKVRFKRLGLVVIDEQHRFGVLQRLRLYEKGDCPDVLAMSATPIPRTLCQTLYGDMDVSVIDEMPPGRLPVHTECFPASKLRAAYERLRGILHSGDRAYVVCSVIEEKEDSGRNSATETHRHLAEKVFPEMGVGLLHGAMDAEEKQEAIRKFREGLLDILVSTTVIEIGIDVPDAGAILITNGECFGLAQLHQIRGRVGRGCRQGYCFVVADARTDAAKERLRIFEKTTDGFKIAAEDLKLRGVGEFFGTRQHGLPEVAMGDLLEDYEMMQQARREAFSIVNEEVSITSREKRSLARELKRSYGGKFRLGFV